MHRHWFDWSAPLLPAVAAWLVDEAERGPLVDLERTCCIVPGRRAGRVLMGALVRRCDEAGRGLLPPRIVTPGLLADVFGVSDRPIASRAECRLAWAQCLEAATPTLIERVGIRSLGDGRDRRGVRAAAAALEDVRVTLAAEGVAMADVAGRAERLERFGEAERWRGLGELEAAYLDVLDACALADPHEPRPLRPEVSDVRIALVGVTDLTTRQRAVIATHPGVVTSLVHAPACCADRFDDLGCLDVDAWQDRDVPVPDEAIVVRETPADQAQAAIAFIAENAEGYAANEMTIGVADDRLAASMTLAAEWAGLEVHHAGGTPLRRTPPYRLLDAIGQWLARATPAAFAALVRHPDLAHPIARRLARGEGVFDWVARLDDYAAKRVPAVIEVTPLAAHDENLGRLWDAVHEILAPLRGRRRRLGGWVDPVRQVLGRVYDGARLDAAASAAGDGLADALAAFIDLRPQLQPAVTAAEAIELFLDEAAETATASETGPGQIEMLGWLELPLDPAPALVLLGANDGIVPESVPSDPFLPDALRRALGVPDDRHRYARDRYRLEALCHTRSAFAVVMGRVDALGDPLAPSRLLAGADDETLVRRTARFCAGGDAGSSGPPAGAPVAGSVSGFTVPTLVDPVIPTHMSVTDFKRYLTCPYRFALDRIERLVERTDRVQELDPMQFGSLVHEVLQRFGEAEDLRDCVDPDTIERFLASALTETARAHYGDHPAPAVAVQLARARQRLRGFAHVQARERRNGWVIQDVERRLPDEATLEVPGAPPMPLRGVIDRIERHADDGAWRIIDYKTGERGDTPFKTHHDNERRPPLGEGIWKDLQLPLYHYLVRTLMATQGERIELAYFVLPKKTDGVRVVPGDWPEPYLASAVACAQGIVRDVRRGLFPMNPDAASPFDRFARICQTASFAGELSGEGAIA
ncbi:MAG: hypothetical protein HKO59_02280 [Phycisphaerales bacterium]|nr:hypothetical protein [Phycisphaerales bacterium]